MTRISKPKVTLIASGKDLEIKSMEANAGELLPRHRASLESVLVVIKGECHFKMADEDHVLKEGDSIIVPAEIDHQIKAVRDLKALHIMPPDIRFDFF